ncbi:hypothetical protein N9L19_00930 [bacterium]|nr:hypothetical protein [bacterium]
MGNFEKLNTVVGDIPDISDIVERSSFNHISVLQTFGVLAEHGFGVNEEATQFFQQAHCRMMISQTCEDAFNEQKNSNTLGDHNASLTRLHNVLVDGKVLNPNHRYDTVDINMGINACERCAGHVMADYKVKVCELPQSIRDIQGLKQKAWWNRPQAQYLGTCFGDLPIITMAMERDELRSLGCAWIGAARHLMHDVVVREVTVAGDSRGARRPW